MLIYLSTTILNSLQNDDLITLFLLDLLRSPRGLYKNSFCKTTPPLLWKGEFKTRPAYGGKFKDWPQKFKNTSNSKEDIQSQLKKDLDDKKNNFYSIILNFYLGVNIPCVDDQK